MTLTLLITLLIKSLYLEENQISLEGQENLSLWYLE